MPALTFDITSEDETTHARVGRVRTPHGSFDTPAFMPVGTQGTVKGLTCTDAQRAEIEDAILRLEALNPTAMPSDSLALEGAWEVTYSNAPPPSNGSLGPFKGTAYQEINLADGTYANRLTVPPNDWLGATLRADWERVDDTLWLVTFRDVTVSVLGFDLFTKHTTICVNFFNCHHNDILQGSFGYGHGAT